MLKDQRLFPQSCMAIEVSGLTVRRDREEIIDELKKSAERGNVLGLFVDGQEEMITTAVTSVTGSDPVEMIVYFQKTDLHGYPLDENPVQLSKIKSVIRFNTLFSDPVYTRIRQRRLGDNLAA